MNPFDNDPFPELRTPHSQNKEGENKPKEKPKCPALFFFGAGASKPAGVPTTVEFVKLFRKTLNENELAAFDEILGLLGDHEKYYKKGPAQPVDAEMMLENIIRFEQSDKDPFGPLYPMKTDGETFRKLKLSDKLKSFIKEKGVVRVEDTLYLRPLKDLITIYNFISIISTNYDIVVEQFCNSEKVSLEDGFGNVFEFERLKNNKAQIKLLKIHGSILWYRSSRGQFYKLQINTESKLETVFGESLDPLIIYPMRKWQYIEPTFEIINEAKRIMRDPDIKFIYVFGYSFRDDHILDIFLDVFRDRRDLYCILVDPEAYKIYENRLKYNDELKMSESSMAGRVICKPFTIQTELEYFFANSLNPLLGTINELLEFRRSSALYGTWNWSHPAYLLLVSNFLSEFENLRQNRGFLELEKEFWDKIRAILIYIANQISAEEYDKIYFSLDELLKILDSGFIGGLQFEPITDAGEKRYRINVTLMDEHGNRRRHDITSFELNNYKKSIIDYWEMLRTKFGISGVNKRKGDWTYDLSYEILDLSRRIYQLFEEVSGSQYGANQPLVKSKIVEIMHGFLTEHKKEYDKPAIKNNPKELVPLYLNILLTEFAKRIMVILSNIKKQPPDGLKWFSSNVASSKE